MKTKKIASLMIAVMLLLAVMTPAYAASCGDTAAADCNTNVCDTTPNVNGTAYGINTGDVLGDISDNGTDSCEACDIPWSAFEDLPVMGLTVGTVVVDISNIDFTIHVVWDDQTIVTLRQSFLEGLTTKRSVKALAMSSEEGYIPLAIEVANWLVDTGTAAPFDGGSFVYGEQCIFVSHTAGRIMTINEAIEAATAVHLKVQYRGEVGLTVDYGDGQVSESVLNVSRY